MVYLFCGILKIFLTSFNTPRLISVRNSFIRSSFQIIFCCSFSLFFCRKSQISFFFIFFLVSGSSWLFNSNSVFSIFFRFYSISCSNSVLNKHNDLNKSFISCLQPSCFLTSERLIRFVDSDKFIDQTIIFFYDLIV